MSPGSPRNHVGVCTDGVSLWQLPFAAFRGVCPASEVSGPFPVSSDSEFHEGERGGG